MNRMLLLVPRMYTEEEFKRVVPAFPEDFGPRTSEFWSYVEDKLQVFAGKIQRIYRDEVYLDGKGGLAHLSSIDRENFLIVRKLVENGAVFEATEDSLLVAESKSWLDMIRQNPLDTMLLELYQETVRERDDYLTRRIDETLLDEETGILFLKPGREINLNECVKIIKVCRFDPADYLRSWQVQLQAQAFTLNSHTNHTQPKT
jgi:hypothetical protein